MNRWTARWWLRAFKATGGIAWLHHGNALGIAWHVAGWTDDQQAEARRLYRQIVTVPARREAARLQLALMG